MPWKKAFGVFYACCEFLPGISDRGAENPEGRRVSLRLVGGPIVDMEIGGHAFSGISGVVF
jgi:hypothetical protein